MKVLRRLPALLPAAAFLLFTSCNKGYGCPTNFSISEVVGSLMALVW
jgi:hypothetical protein